MTQYQRVPPRAIDSRTLRPRRRWYGIGPGVFVLFILIGIGIFVWSLHRFHDFTDDFHELGGPNAAVHLTTTHDTTLYASDLITPGMASGQCKPTGPGQVQVKPTFGAATVTVNGTTWYAVANLHVTKDGDYTASCATAGGVRYAVGSSGRDAVGRIGGFIGGIFALILLPLFGFVIGGVLVLVIALRRNGHKKRLLTAAAAPYGFPPPGNYPPPPRSR